MKTTWLSTWLTLAFVAAFVLAAILTPETPDGRAEHRRVAAHWQQRQTAKGASRPHPRPRAAWRDTNWAHAVQRWDHAAFKRINRGWDNRFFDAVMPAVTKLGDGGVQAGLLLLGLVAAWRLKRRDWQRTMLLGVAGVIAGIVAPLLKMVLPRYRPPAVMPSDLVLLVHPLFGGSFPSGHTLTSFTIATIIATRHRWAAPPAFALAAIIGLSRISVGVHWPLDVIVSAVLGIILGLAVARWGKEKPGVVTH